MAKKNRKPIKQKNLSKASGGAGSTALPQKKCSFLLLDFHK